MHVMRATLRWLGFTVVVFPSARISFSSGFSVTNSASIATKSPSFGISVWLSGLNVKSYCLFLHNCWLNISCWSKERQHEKNITAVCRLYVDNCTYMQKWVNKFLGTNFFMYQIG